MTSRNKIERLKRITKLTESYEKNQQINWKLAKDNLSNAENQLKQLENYFKTYNMESNLNISSQLYTNKARILSMVSDAMVHQKNEINRHEKITDAAHELLKIKTQERKIHEKLTTKNHIKLALKNKKHDSLETHEACMRIFLKKK